MANSMQGMNALDFLMQKCNESTTEFQKRLTLSPEIRSHLESLINQYETTRFPNTKAKGAALENLTKEMFNAYQVFEFSSNIHTSTNEIDFFTRLNHNGQVLKSSGYINMDEKFLIECKNYNKKVDVTFIGKFATLLNTHSQNFGIMVSNKGLTGKGWNDALGLTKKNYLKNGILIISLTINDFRTMLDYPLFEVIEAKKLEIISDTKFEHFLTPHPSMV